MNAWTDTFNRNLDLRYANGDLNLVESYLVRMEQHLKDTAGANWQHALVYNELGGLYQEAGLYQDSLEAFQKARDMGRKGMEPGEYATILNNMAGTLRIMGEYSRAEELFLEAVHMYEAAELQNTAAYASVLNNLSQVYQETRQVDKAIQYQEQMLAAAENIPECRQEPVVIYNNLTALYRAAGNEEKALCCANKALEEYDRLPDDVRRHYTPILNSLAGYLYGAGEYARALAIYQKSARDTLRSCGENEEYGTIHQNMRWVYEKLGDHDGAMECLNRAARVYRKIYGPDHDRTRMVEDDLMRMTAGR